MSDELYLIAHRVRGKPAFDIATKIDLGGEEGWIIPTSGHRAYPLAYWNLDALWICDDYGDKVCTPLDELKALIIHIDEIPDHYPTPTATPGTGTITNLFDRLSFKRSETKIARRV